MNVENMLSKFQLTTISTRHCQLNSDTFMLGNLNIPDKVHGKNEISDNITFQYL